MALDKRTKDQLNRIEKALRLSKAATEVVMTVPEAADFMRMGRRSLDRLIVEKAISFSRAGKGKITLTKSDCIAYLDSIRHASKQEISQTAYQLGA